MRKSHFNVATTHRGQPGPHVPRRIRVRPIKLINIGRKRERAKVSSPMDAIYRALDMTQTTKSARGARVRPGQRGHHGQHA